MRAIRAGSSRSATRSSGSHPHQQRRFDAIPDTIADARGGPRAARRTGHLLPDQGEARADEYTGLEVGEKSPKFTLKDQEGKERSLDEFLGKGKVALVFYRSADW